jgi:hypothetical protein
VRCGGRVRGDGRVRGIAWPEKKVSPAVSLSTSGVLVERVGREFRVMNWECV